MRMQTLQVEGSHRLEVRQADRPWICLYQEHKELLELPMRPREYLLRLYFSAYHRGDRFLRLQEQREQGQPS